MVKELMLSLGYSENDMNEIVSTYPLTNFTEENLFKKIK